MGARRFQIAELRVRDAAERETERAVGTSDEREPERLTARERARGFDELGWLQRHQRRIAIRASNVTP